MKGKSMANDIDFLNDNQALLEAKVAGLQVNMERAFGRIAGLEDQNKIKDKAENKTSKTRFTAGVAERGDTERTVYNWDVYKYPITDHCYGRGDGIWSNRILVYSDDSRLRDRILDLLNSYGVDDASIVMELMTHHSDDAA
jgi:hypothetical protein